MEEGDYMINCYIISTFECGYEPLTALSVFSAIRAVYKEKVSTTLIDTFVDCDCVQQFSQANCVFIAVPIFESLKQAVKIAKDIKSNFSSIKVIFFGQHAIINVSTLLKYADYVIISGNWEKSAVELMENIIKNLSLQQKPIENVIDESALSLDYKPQPKPTVNPSFFPLERSFARPILDYPQSSEAISKLLGNEARVGHIETMRGCTFGCKYCSVFTAYKHQVFLIPVDYILQDVEYLTTSQKMNHLTITDPEFFAHPSYGLMVISALHQRFPSLTYDLTTRIDMILQHADDIKELSLQGVKIITTAVEFPKQTVLDVVNKGITVSQIESAIAILQKNSIVVNPTFITFNPWIDIEDLASDGCLEIFLQRNGLNVDPIQRRTRLHLHNGSAILSDLCASGLNLERKEFHYEWSHPNSAVDALFQERQSAVPDGTLYQRSCFRC